MTLWIHTADSLVSCSPGSPVIAFGSERLGKFSCMTGNPKVESSERWLSLVL